MSLFWGRKTENLAPRSNGTICLQKSFFFSRENSDISFPCISRIGNSDFPTHSLILPIISTCSMISMVPIFPTIPRIAII